ncbi:MAG: FAD-dependent oxidoreductase [Microcoleaceae cyanobacterium]
MVSQIKKIGMISLGFLPILLFINLPNFNKFVNSLWPPKSVDIKTKPIPNAIVSIKPTAKPPATENFDVVVYGDELPGICAAIWAKKTLGKNGKVALVRSNKSQEMLGGLLTRGGLAYLDFDKTPLWYSQPYSQCFRTFLKKANVQASCVEPNAADKALKQMLAEGNIKLISDAKVKPYLADQKIQYLEIPQKHLHLKAHSFIDATQDAELARKSGLSYYRGYESQSPKLKNETLSVSVIPTIQGLNISDIARVEGNILQSDDMMSIIEKRIWRQEDPKSAKFWLNNFWRPIYKAYYDGYYIRSVALGATYHFSHKVPFDTDGFFFDKANICAIGDNAVSWNGFLFKYPVDTLIKMEETGKKPTPEMEKKMASLQEWLQRLSGKKIKFVMPEELYIRHSLNIKDVVDPLTGQEIMKGGTSPEQSIGTFSYEFDLRGGVKGLSLKNPPLPVYNFGIENALASKIKNLAIVGRSSGYVGIAVSVGRILTVNIYQGQGLGVAAAIASQSRISLNRVTSKDVREKLENLTGRRTRFYGRDTSQGVNFSDIK